MTNVKLSDLARDNVPDTAKIAADAVYYAGGTPREQLDAARQVTGRPMGYIPHDGNAARERRRRQATRKAAGASAEEAVHSERLAAVPDMVWIDACLSAC